jgi:hypothetical protein
MSSRLLMAERDAESAAHVDKEASATNAPPGLGSTSMVSA